MRRSFREANGYCDRIPRTESAVDRGIRRGVQKRGGDLAGGVRRSEKSRRSASDSGSAPGSTDNKSAGRIAAVAEAQSAAQGLQLDIAGPPPWLSQDAVAASAEITRVCEFPCDACAGALPRTPNRASKTARTSESRTRFMARSSRQSPARTRTNCAGVKVGERRFSRPIEPPDSGRLCPRRRTQERPGSRS